MNSQSIYYHSTIQNEDEKQALVSVIKQNAPAEAIFLLGQTILQRRTESLFTQLSNSVQYTSHYFFLILINKEAEHTQNAIQDKLENNLQHFIPSTVMVLSIQSFSRWTLEGHPFASLVLKKAVKLYDAANIRFNEPVETGEAERLKENRQLCIHTTRKVEAFLASAELHRLRQEYKLSAFMLHQAAEQVLRAMLILHTGLKINTHNIDKLMRYNSMFCEGFNDLFPRQNEKMKKLYTLLNKAYIDSRYKDDYSISYEELSALTGKVKLVVELWEQHKIPH